LTSTRYCPI